MFYCILTILKYQNDFLKTACSGWRVSNEQETKIDVSYTHFPIFIIIIFLVYHFHSVEILFENFNLVNNNDGK